VIGATLLTPSSLDELVAFLWRCTPESRLLAGGTDLVRAMHQQHREPDMLIDLSGVAELAYVHREADVLRVGATTTFTRLQADEAVRAEATCLAQAAGQVGSLQIRNVGTVGGNIANASACADSVTALVALEASVRTVKAGGAQATYPLSEFFRGAGRTRLSHDEAIVEVVVPLRAAERRSAFAKVGSRSTVSIARLSMALVVTPEPSAAATPTAPAPVTLRDVRVSLGAVGDYAFRELELETLLEDRLAVEETARLFAEACGDAVRRAIPGRYSLPYKEHAVVGLAYDAWNRLGVCAPCEPDWLPVLADA
jgi:CO/xanthine dehydrogenase FAD-binding subunit